MTNEVLLTKENFKGDEIVALASKYYEDKSDNRFLKGAGRKGIVHKELGLQGSNNDIVSVYWEDNTSYNNYYVYELQIIDSWDICMNNFYLSINRLEKKYSKSRK